MIGKLKGLIDSYGEDYVILDVGGVGYQVHCSARTLQALPSPGEAAVLSIETYVREDQIKLFGFRGDVEREWFRLLQTVQGVGAKVALAVLSTLPPSDLANAIALRDKAAVARTPGVGPKVAERIVTELKDKAPAFANVDPALVHLSGAIDDERAPRPVADAISALVNLGYGQPQAAAAIAGASRSERGRCIPPSRAHDRDCPDLFNRGAAGLCDAGAADRDRIQRAAAADVPGVFQSGSPEHGGCGGVVAPCRRDNAGFVSTVCDCRRHFCSRRGLCRLERDLDGMARGSRCHRRRHRARRRVHPR
jgi:Holliday junction DNA helicase RuvA